MECKHEYKEVLYHEQEAIMSRWDYKDHHIGTLNHERIKIFCIKCGDTKDLSANKPSDV